MTALERDSMCSFVRFPSVSVVDIWVIPCYLPSCFPVKPGTLLGLKIVAPLVHVVIGGYFMMTSSSTARRRCSFIYARK